MEPEPLYMIPPLDIEVALSKARHFCNYQERSKQEVKIKLLELNVAESDIKTIINQLEEEGIINEHRFARLYAGGKFRLKHWGKIKINQGLMRKGVPEGLIKEGLKEIDDEEYVGKLRRLIEKKASMLTEKDSEKKKSTLARYALGQGYESSLVWEYVNHYLD